jgi:MFS family permease
MQIKFVFVLTFLGMTATKAVRVLLSLYALRLGAQATTIGFLASTFSVLPVLLSFRAGQLSDRFGARWLLVVGAVGSALGLLAPAAVASVTAVFIAAMMSGMTTTFFNVSLQNLVGLLSTPENRANYYSNFSLVVSVASFIGPLFIGFFIDHLGYAESSLFLVFLTLLPAVLLIGWGSRLPRGSGAPKKKKQREGRSRSPVALQDVMMLLVTSGIVQVAIDMYQFYMPVYGHAVNLSAAAIGVTVALYAAAAFVVRTLMPALLRRYPPQAVLGAAFYLGALGFFVVPFFQGAVALSVVSFVFGLGLGVGQPITMMMTFSSSAEGRSGEALGLRLTINQITRLIAPAMFGWLGSMAGLSWIFWVNALLLLVGGMYTQTQKTAAQT